MTDEEAWDVITCATDGFTGPEDHYMVSLDQVCQDITDWVRDAAQNPWTVTSDEANAFAGDVLLKEAIETVGSATVLERYPIPPEE